MGRERYGDDRDIKAIRPGVDTRHIGATSAVTETHRPMGGKRIGKWGSSDELDAPGGGRMATERAQTTPINVVLAQLAEHLPICLIMDLTMPAGPHSTELLARERSSTASTPRPPARMLDTRTDFVAGTADC